MHCYPEERKSMGAYKDLTEHGNLMTSILAGTEWLVSDIDYTNPVIHYTSGILEISIVHKSMDGRCVKVVSKVRNTWDVRYYEIAFTPPCVEHPFGTMVSHKQPRASSNYYKQAPKDRTFGSLYGHEPSLANTSLSDYIKTTLSVALDVYSNAYTQFVTKNKTTQAAMIEAANLIKLLNEAKKDNSVGINTVNRLKAELALNKTCKLLVQVSNKGYVTASVEGKPNSVTKTLLALLKNPGKIIDKSAVVPLEQWSEAYEECQL